MRFVLISTEQPELTNDNLDPPLGLMYLSAVIRNAGHDVRILDFAGGRQHCIPEADVYGFSTYTATYWRTLEKKNKIQSAYPSAKFICGGTHASALPKLCSKDGWDCVVVGEGEQAVQQLVKGNKLSKVFYSARLNIDLLPFPDYTDIDVSSYDRMLDGMPLLSMLTSRGCPYRCNFCGSIMWNRARKVRFRNPADIALEINYLGRKFRTTHFRFVDDLFAISAARVRRITQALCSLDIVYRCTARCNTLSAEMAEMLKDSGCVQVDLGVESGSEVVLNYMNKKQTPSDILRAIKAVKDTGMRVRIYLIVGFPGETWGTIDDTCDLMLEAMPDEMLIYAPIPFPGTPLYEHPEDFGITWMEQDFSKYVHITKNKGAGYVISHKTADASEIKAMREYVIDKLSDISWCYGKR